MASTAPLKLHLASHPDQKAERIEGYPEHNSKTVWKLKLTENVLV
jgi:hypothetical protein